MGWLVFSLVLLIGIAIPYFVYTNHGVVGKEKCEKETRIFRLVESSKDVVYYYQVKPERKFLYLSPAIDTFLGTGVQSDSYKNPDVPFERIHPEDREFFTRKINGELDYSQEFIQRWRDSKGRYRWFEEYATPIYENGEYVAIEGIIRNIDEKIKLKEKLEYRLTHDTLTNIHNREFFEQLMEKYNNTLDISISIILCDLDNLKHINDTYGHKTGDQLIQETAKLLNQCIPDNTTVSRIGGDEFAIIFPTANWLKGEGLIAKLKNEMVDHNLGKKDFPIQMSIGYAFNPHSQGNMKNIFAEADMNMYKNKNTKKKDLILSI